MEFGVVGMFEHCEKVVDFSIKNLNPQKCGSLLLLPKWCEYICWCCFFLMKMESPILKFAEHASTLITKSQNQNQNQNTYDKVVFF